MIAAENLSKSYASRILFDHISFKINAKERVGLVGRNGHGKTTLFRILLGEEEYDSGTLNLPKNYRIGHVAQHLAFSEKTVLEEGMRGLPPNEKDHHWKVERILTGLGFSEPDMEKPPAALSGGFQVRLNLAKTLVSEPDLLLLDEPTNYLDITSIRWVRRFLMGWPRELVLITHDRDFMDRIVTHVMGIHRKKLRKIPGDTGKYYTQIAQDEEVYEKTRVKDERRIREIERFITRFRAKARLAGMVQSRIKSLAKKEKKKKLEKVRELEFAFSYKPFRGKHLLRVDALSFGYPGEQTLMRDFEFSLHSKDRVCVIGPNGKGKTTLLKLLAGVLNPVSGAIVYSPDTALGFYEQTNVHHLRENFTVVQEIQGSLEDRDHQKARNICGAMLFEGDEALKMIMILSGGEKARVTLGKVIAAPVNLLLLDEPTNHLDMESADALLEAIDAFEGAVILVTHNEMYLHALAQRLIIFRQDRIDLYEGSYRDFLEAGGWEEARAEKIPESVRIPPETPGDLKAKKTSRKMRSRILEERARRLKPIEHEIAATENEIEILEQKLEKIQVELISASQGKEGGRIAELSIRMHRLQQEIEDHFHRLETIYLEKEAVVSDFSRRLDSPENL